MLRFASSFLLAMTARNDCKANSANLDEIASAAPRNDCTTNNDYTMENERTEKGTFLPGNKGKPKGVKNKITREQKEKVEWVLGLLDENVEEDLKKMKPSDRIRLWADLQEYIRPKLQRVNLDVGADDKEITKITFELVDSSGKVLDE